MKLSECLSDLVEITREYNSALENVNRLDINSVSETAQWLKGQSADRQRHRKWRDEFFGFLDSLDDKMLRDILSVMLIGRDGNYSAFETNERRLQTARGNADIYRQQGKYAMVKMISKEPRLHTHLIFGMKMLKT